MQEATAEEVLDFQFLSLDSPHKRSADDKEDEGKLSILIIGFMDG